MDYEFRFKMPKDLRAAPQTLRIGNDESVRALAFSPNLRALTLSTRDVTTIDVIENKPTTRLEEAVSSWRRPKMLFATGVSAILVVVGAWFTFRPSTPPANQPAMKAQAATPAVVARFSDTAPRMPVAVPAASIQASGVPEAAPAAQLLQQTSPATPAAPPGGAAAPQAAPVAPVAPPAPVAVLPAAAPAPIPAATPQAATVSQKVPSPPTPAREAVQPAAYPKILPIPPAAYPKILPKPTDKKVIAQPVARAPAPAAAVKKPETADLARASTPAVAPGTPIAGKASATPTPATQAAAPAEQSLDQGRFLMRKQDADAAQSDDRHRIF